MEQTLLLNATYEPLKVVHWQKAITLWCQGKVEIIAEHDREIRSVSFKLKLPSVIRLLRYVRIKKRFDYVPFSRANIYARDGYSCQYCAKSFPTQELTFDHVVPVSQGGRKDWENIVTCCDSDHHWPAQRPRQLARLSLLESRAGRDLAPRFAELTLPATGIVGQRRREPASFERPTPFHPTTQHTRGGDPWLA
jgi:5-methylcytosine-specific restriction endonuclease McrA